LFIDKLEFINLTKKIMDENEKGIGEEILESIPEVPEEEVEEEDEEQI